MEIVVGTFMYFAVYNIPSEHVTGMGSEQIWEFPDSVEPFLNSRTSNSSVYFALSYKRVSHLMICNQPCMILQLDCLLFALA